MITTKTLHLSQSSKQAFLPAFWRLGQLSTGLPVLWPMTYQQAIIVECSAKSHREAYRLVENCLVSLLQRTPNQQLRLTIYEHSLKSSFPALKQHSQQPKAAPIQLITHKKQLKDYVGELQQKAHQRQALLAEQQLVTWHDYMVINKDAEPLEVLVLSQVWPDVELLVELADLCQYGVLYGILPILIISSRYFAKTNPDDWQANLNEILAELTAHSLQLVVHKDASLEIKHQELHDIADLYDFFKPTIDVYEYVG